jgi:hypothetical protein
MLTILLSVLHCQPMLVFPVKVSNSRLVEREQTKEQPHVESIIPWVSSVGVADGSSQETNRCRHETEQIFFDDARYDDARYDDDDDDDDDAANVFAAALM